MGVIQVERPPVDRNIFSKVVGYCTSIGSGMKLTLTIMVRQLLGLEKSSTLEWPEKPAAYGPRFKGKHILTLREDGQLRCTACFLCATACPADCIHIEAAEHDDPTIEKYPKRFDIDILRCVFCGLCEEACPVDAIRLGPEFLMVGGPEQKWVFSKEHLSQRPELMRGIHSVRDENAKHPAITHVPRQPNAQERCAHVPRHHP